jgi:hypothetical protein
MTVNCGMEVGGTATAPRDSGPGLQWRGFCRSRGMSDELRPPVKALSAYMHFVKAKRSEVRDSNPGEWFLGAALDCATSDR